MTRVEGGAHGDFYSCSGYPDCKSTIDLQGNGELAPLCPADGTHGHMRRRAGKNGVFWSCRRDGCRATRELDLSFRPRAQRAAGEGKS
jgi:ssDNA-binding Zn-finger/Zn-ribbon topoisomerase 1